MTTWDTIIVGAGSASAALACRLSEESNRRVLLLEAGVNYTSAQTPAAIVANGPDSLAAMDHMWPQLMAVCAEGQSPRLYLRGRGVGGSSAVNAQLAIRGLPSDYDNWATHGCEGWDARSIEPSFVRVAERIPALRAPQDQWSAYDQAFHGVCVARGHAAVESYENEGVVGVSPVGLTRRANRRVSTNDAYLEPARRRPNLEIRGNVLVDRVIVENGRAVGVRTQNSNFMGRQIVISAGAIHSPAILLRSGLGEKRPGVGRNLIEHPLMAAFVSLAPGVAMRGPDAPFIACALRWSSMQPGCGEADLQMLALNKFQLDPTTDAVRVIASIMQPFSRGAVTLASDAPEIDPQVEFRLLSDPRDAVRMRIVAREMAAILDSPPIKSISEGVAYDNARPESLGDCISDDVALDGWLLANVFDYVHAVGTCKMGSPDDPTAVVDPKCRFIGVEGLSVVDASVMPMTPRANTHLSAVMIGEHAAQFL